MAKRVENLVVACSAISFSSRVSLRFVAALPSQIGETIVEGGVDVESEWGAGGAPDRFWLIIQWAGGSHTVEPREGEGRVEGINFRADRSARADRFESGIEVVRLTSKGGPKAEAKDPDIYTL